MPTDELPTAAVLLSHYNGLNFLRDQIESLLNQQGVNVHVYVRDDGSTCTKSLNNLRHIDASHDCVSVIYGENLGSCNSFFLMVELYGGADFYAFSDQDDVWDLDKLQKAVLLLQATHKADEPALYFSNLNIVDESLNFISLMHKEQFPLTFDYAFFRNKCSGCTMVFNNKLRDTYLPAGRPAYAVMHDWWFLLFAYCVGSVVYDSAPSINYRQHSSNVIGAKHSYYKRWKDRLRRLLFSEQGRNERLKQGRALLNVAGDIMSAEKYALLSRLVATKRDFKTKLQLCKHYHQCMSNRFEGFFVSLIIMLNLY